MIRHILSFVGLKKLNVLLVFATQGISISWIEVIVVRFDLSGCQNLYIHVCIYVCIYVKGNSPVNKDIEQETRMSQKPITC